MDVSPGDSQTQLKQLEQSVCSAIVLHVDCLLQHSLQTSFSRQAGSRIELGGEGGGFQPPQRLESSRGCCAFCPLMTFRRLACDKRQVGVSLKSLRVLGFV